MKKIMLIILSIFLIFIIACQQTIKKGEVPDVGASGDAAVDSVGSSLNNVDSIEKELNTDELSNLDSGFQDVQNI